MIGLARFAMFSMKYQEHTRSTTHIYYTLMNIYLHKLTCDE